MFELENVRKDEWSTCTCKADAQPENTRLALDAMLQETRSVLMDTGELLDALLLHTEGEPQNAVTGGESAEPRSLMENAAINRKLANGVREKVRHLTGLMRTD